MLCKKTLKYFRNLLNTSIQRCLSKADASGYSLFWFYPGSLHRSNHLKIESSIKISIFNLIYSLCLNHHFVLTFKFHRSHTPLNVLSWLETQQPIFLVVLFKTIAATMLIHSHTLVPVDCNFVQTIFGNGVLP